MGVNGVFYRQQHRDSNGYRFYVGEDAYPFLCDSFMIVADGLGGDGGFNHTRMNPEMWDRERRARLLGLEEEELRDEALMEYFAQLFRELDRDSQHGRKPERYVKVPALEPHSGYFGSALTSFATASLLRHSKKLNPEYLFEMLDRIGDDEGQRNELLKKYADRLCEKLLDRVKDFARRANLMKETPRMAAKLLPTTLCVAMHRELADGRVQVICVWAGDSRICAQLPEGTVQLTADDEKDEGMTNLISLSTRPYLNVRAYTFAQPFMLMAVSDGTFDDLENSLSFEAMVVLNALEVKSREERHACWMKLFSSYSTDDSASIAYRCFGLENDAALNAFVAPRIAALHRRLGDVGDEYLFTNYKLVIERLQRDYRRAVREVCKELTVSPELLEKCKAQEEKTPSAAYAREKERIAQLRSDMMAENLGARAALTDHVTGNWLEFRGEQESSTSNELAENLRALRERIGRDREDFSREIESARDTLAQLLQMATDRLSGLEVDAHAEDSLAIDMDHAMELNGIIHSIVEICNNPIGTIVDDKHELQEDFRRHCTSFREKMQDLVAEEALQIESAVADIIEGNAPESEEKLPEALQASLITLRSALAREQALAQQEKEALEKAARNRAELAVSELTEKLGAMEDLPEDMDGELRGRVEPILKEYREKIAEARSRREEQIRIQAENNERYMQYIKEA